MKNMLRFYSIVVFPWIIHQFVMGIESTFEENKVYYKPTGVITKNKIALKDLLIPIVIEGQPPLSKLSSTEGKMTTTIKITDKSNKNVPHKSVSIRTSKDFYNTSEGTAITDLSTASKLHKHIATNLTLLSNSTKNFNNSHITPVSEITNKQTEIKTQTEELNRTIFYSLETTKRTKPKPAVTIGEKEADKPIPASPTNKSPFGIPRKIDYIVPGVITVTVLPLMVIVFYILYKRGRDYWDKRHYRRMDFLIDGMYNE